MTSILWCFVSLEFAILVRLVLPVHVGGDGLAHALGHGNVGVVL